MASTMLKVAAVLWVVWGAVHAFAGVMTISGEPTMKVAGIADAVDPATLDIDYPAAVPALLNQHGFNLLWFGIVTLIGGLFIWSGHVTAIFATAVVGGLADLGYFIFLDLGGFVNFVPGTVMTLISASAILLSVAAYFLSRRPS